MYRLNYVQSDVFETAEEAYEYMRQEYHYNAIEGNIWDENEPGYITSATINKNSAEVKYKDGLILKWDIVEETN